MGRYMERDQQQMDAAIRELSGADAVRALFAHRVAKVAPRDGMRGCFLQVSGTSGSSTEIVEEVSLRAAREMHAWLVRELKTAQADGDLAPDASVAAVADLLMVLNSGLSASARGGLPTKSVKAAAAEALDRIFARPAVRRAR